MSNLTNYNAFIIFIFISFTLSTVLILLAYLTAPKNSTVEKLSAYECGFEPFSDTRQNFDVHFYIVSILFVIFDLEIAFLLPWAVNVDPLGSFGFFSAMFFVFILIAGFAYEWKIGALDWVK